MKFLRNNPAIPTVIACCVSLGCHVTSRVDETILSKPSWQAHEPAEKTLLSPQAFVTPVGTLRFFSPAMCMSDFISTQKTYRTVTKSPNMATIVVGLITTSLGIVFTVSELSGEDPGGSPTTYLGATAALAGLPLVVGPFVGNTKEKQLVSTNEIQHKTGRAACGKVPLGQARAVIRTDHTTIRGIVNEQGTFSISPFEWVDAYQIDKTPSTDLQVAVHFPNTSTKTFRTLLLASALVKGRDGFFSSTGVKGEIQQLDRVPRLKVSGFRISNDPAMQGQQAVVSFTVSNNGPGDAWGVRGRLHSPDPELNGRMAYVGHLPARSRVTKHIRISKSAPIQRTTQLALRLLDAHNTAPGTPLRWNPRQPGVP